MESVILPAQLEILMQVIVRKLRLSGDFDFKSVATRTPGFVGADLQALTKEAAAVAIARIFNALPLPRDPLQMEGPSTQVSRSK